MSDLPSIMGNVTLKKLECLVVLDEAGDGWVIARSEYIRDRDILMEMSTEDNGFHHEWSKGFCLGVYLLKIKPWGHQDYQGEWNSGIDVVEATPLWTAENAVQLE